MVLTIIVKEFKDLFVHRTEVEQQPSNRYEYNLRLRRLYSWIEDFSPAVINHPDKLSVPVDC